MKIKAAVVNNVGEDYVIEELQLGELRDDEVLVKMVASGICHSDEALRVGDTPANFPIILGHEGSGIIEKLGNHVRGFEVGDHVVLSYATCGVCEKCKEGKPASCDQWYNLNMVGKRLDDSYTFSRSDGTPVHNFFMQSSFASHSIVNQTNLIKVSKETDLRYLGPFGCGLSTGSGTVDDVLRPRMGSSMAVFGTGAVGFGTLMTAKISGCSTIIAVDIFDSKLELAKELGATHTINSRNENVQERIAEITNNKGVDYSVDTTGVEAVINTSIEVLGEGGQAVPLAVTKNTITLNTTMDLSNGNRSIIGVKMGRTVPQLAIPKLVDFYEKGQFEVKKLTKFYKHEDINQANADAKSGQAIKPILIIDEEYRKDEPLV